MPQVNEFSWICLISFFLIMLSSVGFLIHSLSSFSMSSFSSDKALFSFEILV